LPHYVSREAAVFAVMLTRGHSGTRAGAFIIPIPGAIARAMKRRPRCDPLPNGRAQRCPCPKIACRDAAGPAAADEGNGGALNRLRGAAALNGKFRCS
jgi:hypothetical protein